MNMPKPTELDTNRSILWYVNCISIKLFKIKLVLSPYTAQELIHRQIKDKLLRLTMTMPINCTKSHHLEWCNNKFSTMNSKSRLPTGAFRGKNTDSKYSNMYPLEANCSVAFSPYFGSCHTGFAIFPPTFTSIAKIRTFHILGRGFLLNQKSPRQIRTVDYSICGHVKRKKVFPSPCHVPYEGIKLDYLNSSVLQNVYS